MKSHAGYRFLALALLFVSCGALKMNLGDVDDVSDVSALETAKSETIDDLAQLLDEYSIDFEVNNPLIDANSRMRRFDPNHERIIKCRATLLDTRATEAEISYQSLKDSLDSAASDEFRNKYVSEQLRDGMFRIRISMESGFSPKSMEPDHWTIYLENSRGIMIEPNDITTSSVSTIEDSVYSDFYRVNLPRRLLTREITLYYSQTTFFGEDLLSPKNPFIVLVMARNKRTLARVAWKTSKFTHEQ
ncbi:hypothetical protein ACFL47_03645 [Candidatus Latescibacterota bacterium]